MWNALLWNMLRVIPIAIDMAKKILLDNFFYFTMTNLYSFIQGSLE